MLTKKYYKLIRVSYADSDLFRITNISDQAGILTITGGGGTLKYSLDGVDFTTYDFTTHPTISVPAGGNCYMKGNKSTPTSNFMQFSMDVNHSIGGNIISILDETNYATTTSMPNFALNSLFKNDTYLIDASQLNFGQATRISAVSTFQDCTSLSGVPDFSNATSLQINSCFSGCTSLVTPPDFSNVTQIEHLGSCFSGCTSLLTPPDLSSVTVISNQGFSNTFAGCTSLTQPATVTNLTNISNQGLSNMYKNCTSLTNGMDIRHISNVDSNGMGSMYEGCTSLTTAYAPNFQTWTGTRYWLRNVAATGTLYCPSQTVADLIPDNSVDGCPSGWTKVVA